MNSLVGHVRETAAVFGIVARNSRLRLVVLARLASVTGRWAATVALGVFAYRHGGAQSVGVLAVARILPVVAAGPFTALLLKRFHSDRLLFAAGLARTAVVAGVAALMYANAGNASLYVLVGLMALLSTMVRPLQSATLPYLVTTPHELTATNLSLATIESFGMLLGPLVAGVIMSFSQPGAVLALTAALYGLSTLLVRLLPAPEIARKTGMTGFRETFDGLLAIHRDRRLRLVAGLYTAENFVAGALNVLLVVAALNLLSLGNSGVGILNATIGFGGLVAAFAAGAVIGRKRVASSLGLGLVLFGAPIALIGAVPRTVSTLLLLVLVGAGVAIVNFSSMTLLQRAIPDDALASVFSMLQSLFVGTLGVGALVAPVLVGQLGVRGALLVSGGALSVLAVLRWRPLILLDSERADDDEAVDLLQGIPIFGPLPLPTLERLARSLEPVDVPAGAVVVREGDEGDRYYAVRSGRVRVASSGQDVKVLGAGDGFGEIALLRDVPRTATVTALDDSRLYALDRDSFLECVAGTPSSRGAADELVDTRLAELRSVVASI